MRQQCIERSHDHVNPDHDHHMSRFSTEEIALLLTVFIRLEAYPPNPARRFHSGQRERSKHRKLHALHFANNFRFFMTSHNVNDMGCETGRRLLTLIREDSANITKGKTKLFKRLLKFDWSYDNGEYSIR